MKQNQSATVAIYLLPFKDALKMILMLAVSNLSEDKRIDVISKPQKAAINGGKRGSGTFIKRKNFPKLNGAFSSNNTDHDVRIC